jgi:hypothetical protein
MEVTYRALITELHGIFFGTFFLLAIYGLVVELCRSHFLKQPADLTAKGYNLQSLYLFVMAALGWAAVFSGAYIVYPWYRAVPPAGANLVQYPRYLLLSSPATAQWHSIGMEWKEHIAFIAVIAATMLAYVLHKYRFSIRQHPQVRTAVLLFAIVAFSMTGIAGFFGAMLNKEAPVQGGTMIHLMGAEK